MTQPLYDIGQICQLDKWETFINGQPFDTFTRLRKEAPVYWHEEILPFENGFWVSPTVIDGLTPDSRCATEEIFGPVPTLFDFKNEDEAIEIANSTDYGLGSGVFNSICKSDALAELPPNTSVTSGQLIKVLMFDSLIAP